MSFEIGLRHRIGAREVAIDFGSDARLTALVGASGTGKTTVLNCIAGLARADEGRIVVGGRVLFDPARGIDLPPEQRRAGYVFQDGRLFPHRKVAANLAYGERLAPPGEQRMSREEVAEFLGIAHLAERWPATLSGGEARRVAIGRALLAAPRFLLLDEPLTSLDPERAEGITQAIERIRDELALPILLVSHDRAEVARLGRAGGDAGLRGRGTASVMRGFSLRRTVPGRSAGCAPACRSARTARWSAPGSPAAAPVRRGPWARCPR